MRNYFSILSSAVLILFSVSAFAATVLSKEELPEKIRTAFDKKHPTAINFAAEQKTHFGQELYLISFKENKEAPERSVQYYRVNGNFYVNGDDIDTAKTSVEMPPASYENLKAAFNDYDIKEAILVVNPNGAGEEFDLVVSASGTLWHIALDRNGKIIKKAQ